ncbi:MAG: DUF1592 domain-containing protein [Gemmataceae bacterium]|nr:DUF1592 domain-containing protein [Gemmataceae bacterium]
MHCRILPILIAALTATVPASAADPPALWERDIGPFLKQYCNSCHGWGKAKGDLNLIRFQSATEALTAPDKFGEAGKRVDRKEMPPEGSPQPTEAERAVFVRYAQFVAKPPKDTDCRQLANDQNTHFYKGHVMSRRLTRAEYFNCVRDLTGVSLPVADLLPADGAGGEGFDTTGDTLFISAIHLEKYLEASRRAVEGLLAASGDRKYGETARQVVEEFARLAWRRPVSPAEVDRLLGVYDEVLPRAQALRRPLQAILLSPNFLFLIEPLPAEEGVSPLSQHALASRLSFFLWSTMPDDELLGLADRGELNTDAALARQVGRMLADPRIVGLGENFGLQWLGLIPLTGTHQPDRERFPEFDSALADSMRGEAIAFVTGVFRDNRPVTDFIESDYVWVNERLARHYGIAGVTGTQFRRTARPGPERGGLLGLGGMLTVTSYPLRTSPVIRGKWVLEEVLGAKVPPPPPGAGELPRDDRLPDNLTMRQRLAQHRSRPECATCHVRMDELGFGLENFDPIGRWRTTNNGLPVDATGKLPSGVSFTGPAELRQTLMKQKSEFERHLSRKLLGYALGRALNKYDECVVDDCCKALASSGERAAVLIERIVLSYPFRHRYYKP